MDNQKEDIPMISFRKDGGAEVLKITSEGEIFYIQEEEMVKAQTDNDLGKAFSLCIAEMSGMDYKNLLSVYLGEALEDLKVKVIKELFSGKETATQADFIKIMDDLKSKPYEKN